MNATFALCAAVLAALPSAEPSRPDVDSVYPESISTQFNTVIRAQNAGPVLTTPMMTIPSSPETTTMYQPASPVIPGSTPYAAPVGPFGVPTISSPYVYDPSYVPGAAMQENRWGFYAGYDNVILKPYFNYNSGSVGPAGGGINGVSSRNVDWGFTYSPRVWIGLIEPNGTGAQVRFWNFDSDEDGNGGSQELKIQVIDAEKVWHFSNSGVALSVGAGMRYAQIDEKLATSAGGPSIGFDRNFNGFGPTLSVSGRRRVNQTNWALFASGRLSGLYGNTSSSITDNAGAFIPIPGVIYHEGQDFVGVTDLQFGVDWSAPISYHTNFFVRIAGEAQLWLGGGLPTPSAINGTQNNGNLGLFGLTVGTGLSF